MSVFVGELGTGFSVGVCTGFCWGIDDRIGVEVTVGAREAGLDGEGTVGVALGFGSGVSTGDCPSFGFGGGEVLRYILNDRS